MPVPQMKAMWQNSMEPFLGSYLLDDHEASDKRMLIAISEMVFIQAVADILEETELYFDFIVQGASAKINVSFHS
jgi:hypothetical protein